MANKDQLHRLRDGSTAKTALRSALAMVTVRNLAI